MSKVIDCGGFSIAIRVVASARYVMPPEDDEEELARLKRGREITAHAEELEEDIAFSIAEKLGLSREQITEIQDAKAAEEAEAREAEERGRAEKAARRANRPPPPPPRGESVKPGETPHEVQAREAAEDEEPES